MLNIIDSSNLSITPMNYYLTFAASDNECELEMALRVNRQQHSKLADLLLLANAADCYIDVPLDIPVEITRTMDAGDGLNCISENLSSKVVWVGVDSNGVTLSVAGYQHAVRISYMLFESKITELYTALVGCDWKVESQMVSHPVVGNLTVFSLGGRSVVRQQDVMFAASYNNVGARRLNQPLMFYVQDIEGLWLQTPHAGSARWARFVSQTVNIPV